MAIKIKDVRDALGITNADIAKMLGFKDATSYSNSPKRKFYEDTIITIFNSTKDIMSNNRFIVKPSETKGYHIITDTTNMIVVQWQQGDFNNTQKAIELYETSHLSVTEIAHSMREIGDYLVKNHAKLL